MRTKIIRRSRAALLALTAIAAVGLVGMQAPTPVPDAQTVDVATVSNAWAVGPHGAALPAGQPHTIIVTVEAPALGAPGVVPDVLTWTPSGYRCNFDLNHWENVFIHVDTVGTRVKAYQFKITGTEPVLSIEGWEAHAGAEYKTGEIVSAATSNWTSAVSGLPYMAAGSDTGIVRIKRTGTITNYCKRAVPIG